MRYTGKPLARKALKLLDKSLGSFVDQAWDVKHKQWVTQELRELAARHGLSLGGEGVAHGAAAANGNELRPSAKNPQCASKDRLGRAIAGLPPAVSPNGQCAIAATAVAFDRWPGTPDPALATMTVQEPTHGPVAVPDLKAPLWPTEATLTVQGYCPNPKLLRAVLPDGTGVSMYRGARNWRSGDKVPARLTLGGGSPIYTAV